MEDQLFSQLTLLESWNNQRKHSIHKCIINENRSTVKYCFCLSLLHLDVWLLLCKMMSLQSLTLETKVSLCSSHGMVCNLQTCDVETWNLQSTYTEKWLFSLVKDMSSSYNFWNEKHLDVHKFWIFNNNSINNKSIFWWNNHVSDKLSFKEKYFTCLRNIHFMTDNMLYIWI